MSRLVIICIFFCSISPYANGGPNLKKAETDTTGQKLITEAIRLSKSPEKIDALLKAALFFVNKPGEFQQDLTLAQQYGTQGISLSKELKNKPGLAKSYTVLSQIKREDGKNNQGMRYSDSALLVIKNITDPRAKADVYFERSKYYSLARDTNITLKIHYYDKGVENLKLAAPGSIELADAEKFLGNLENWIGENLRSYQLLDSAIAIYKQKNYPQVQDAYAMMSSTLSCMNNYKEALNYGLLAVRTAERFHDSSMTVCLIYNRLAYIYNNLNDDKKSVESIRKALYYSNYNKDQTSTLVLMGNLATGLTTLRQYKEAKDVALRALTMCNDNQTELKTGLMTVLVKIYTSTKDYTEAEKTYKEIAGITANSNIPDIVWDNFYAAGIGLYMQLQRYDEAKQLIEKYRAVNKVTGNLNSMMRAEGFAYKTDSMQGKFDQAFLHYQSYKQISDSISNRNHTKELATLQLQFDVEKKDEALLINSKNIELLTKQTQLQKQALKNGMRIRNLSVVAVLMLLILSAVIYNRYKLKRKAHRDLEIKQSEINRQNDALKQLVTEREWLLKEVHHRVKNNLQIIISLLNSQASFLENDPAKDVIRESKNRVNSISMIHQKLYQTENLGAVRMEGYVHELVDTIYDSFGAPSGVHLNLQIEDIQLDVAQAVPLGLIINETVTNSFKYAFNPDATGNLEMILSSNKNEVFLKIKDDGKHLQPGTLPKTTTSFGLSLIKGLSKQLGGHLSLNHSDGWELILIFKIQTKN